MRPLTADDYRTAFEVVTKGLGFHADGEVASLIQEQLDKSQKLDDYARELGQIALSSTTSPVVSGIYLIHKLFEDGWKAPEGMF